MLLVRLRLAHCKRKVLTSSCLVQLHSAAVVQLLLPPLIGLCYVLLVIPSLGAAELISNKITNSSLYSNNYNSDLRNDNIANNSRQLSVVGSIDVQDNNGPLYNSTDTIQDTRNEVQVVLARKMDNSRSSSVSSSQQQSNSIIPAANPNFEAAFQGKSLSFFQ